MTEKIEQLLHSEEKDVRVLLQQMADWVSNNLTTKVESLKEQTQKDTGSFKYDDCYDEVLELLKPNQQYNDRL